jgi:hypothetical protein
MRAKLIARVFDQNGQSGLTREWSLARFDQNYRSQLGSSDFGVVGPKHAGMSPHPVRTSRRRRRRMGESRCHLVARPSGRTGSIPDEDRRFGRAPAGRGRPLQGPCDG